MLHHTVGPRRERLDDCTEILCASSEALHTCSGESKLRAGHVAIQGVEKDASFPTYRSELGFPMYIECHAMCTKKKIVPPMNRVGSQLGPFLH